jgi:hypothetical protein
LLQRANFRCLKRSTHDKNRVDADDCSQNSGGIAATSSPHHFTFFKISVAFIFKRSLELAHQASQSCFGNKTGVTSRNVNDALGVQKQPLFAREANQ